MQRRLSAAFTLAEGRVTVGTLARACGITTSAVGLWLRHDGVVGDPGMIKAIQIAFADAAVVLEHGQDDSEDADDVVLVVDGWVARPVGDV
jgi:hypothetical protein